MRWGGAFHRHETCTSQEVQGEEVLMPATATPETMNSLSGQVIRWTFESGPTAGSTYEHTFEPDGSVSFRKIDGEKRGEPKREKKYGSFEVSKGVQLVSYLSDSGYTLTVAMNLDDGRLVGFASNDKEWYPVSGTLEVVK
jgi:hypothetical protein